MCDETAQCVRRCAFKIQKHTHTTQGPRQAELLRTVFAQVILNRTWRPSLRVEAARPAEHQAGGSGGGGGGSDSGGEEEVEVEATGLVVGRHLSAFDLTMRL
jgi:hypothetical protein